MCELLWLSQGGRFNIEIVIKRSQNALDQEQFAHDLMVTVYSVRIIKLLHAAGRLILPLKLAQQATLTEFRKLIVQQVASSAKHKSPGADIRDKVSISVQ